MAFVSNHFKAALVFAVAVLALFFMISCSGQKQNDKTRTDLSSADQDLVSQAMSIMSPIPDQIVSTTNPLNEAKVKLGKMLYYDTRLSRSNTISCNSCHNLATYGVDNNRTAMGHGWTRGPRNSPTVLNAAGQVAQFWDGRAKDVEEQAQGPIMNPIEMGGMDKSQHEVAVKRISDIPEYRELFVQAFPPDKNEVSLENIANAIAAFERTLMTPSRLDKFLKGDGTALTAEEKKGLSTFISTGCTSCHNGSHVGGAMLQKFGLVKGPYWQYTGDKEIDKGKAAVTGNASDDYIFKVPTLRNIVHTYPYFHDGSVWNLRKAVVIMGETQLGRDLSEGQVDEIMVFLKSLTGVVPEDALVLPLLPPSPPDAPKPDDVVL